MTADPDATSAALAAEAERRLLRAERMECLAALTSGLTHSFSNLLASTLMSIDRVLEVVPEGAQRQLLLALEGMTREGLQVVRQLLWIARNVGEEQPLVFQPQYLLVEVKKLLAAAATPSGSPLIATHYPPDLWALRGDPLRFVQLLLALALEAARTAPPGASLVLHAANVASRGEVPGPDGATAAAYHVAIQAAAQLAGAPPPPAGPPAPPPRSRLPVLSAAPGAWIVDRVRHSAAALADAAGGVCRALPPENGGGLVVFLPAIAPEAAAPPPPVEHLPRGAGERVLVFEDEPMLAAALCEVLGGHGYRAAAAGSAAGLTAAAAAGAAAPAEADLVLAAARLDSAGNWQMAPGAAGATVPIVLMVDVETAERFDRLTPGERRGITPHAMLRKPFTSRKLLQALAALPRFAA
jgi:CheY-like chemotaxis protein